MRLTTAAIAARNADASLSRARALQQSMRTLMADTSQDTTNTSFAHPSAWAPFQLIGVE